LNLHLYWLRKEDKGIPEVPVGVDIPHEFLCPITHEIMHDPVLCSGNDNTFHASGVTDTQTTGISPGDYTLFSHFFL
jgi:U-box domain.